MLMQLCERQQSWLSYQTDQLIGKSYHQKYLFSSEGNVRYQETVNVICLFSRVRFRTKQTKTFSINFQRLTSAVWH